MPNNEGNPNDEIQKTPTESLRNYSEKPLRVQSSPMVPFGYSAVVDNRADGDPVRKIGRDLQKRVTTVRDRDPPELADHWVKNRAKTESGGEGGAVRRGSNGG